MATKTVTAMYSGTCARTGRQYGAGTRITQIAPKKWAIAEGAAIIPVAEYRSVRIAPLAPSTEPVVKQINIASPFYCSCAKSVPGFKVDDPATYAQCAFQRTGNALQCGNCGRTGEILPVAPVERIEPETRRCWECGREFTYAQCQRNGGDWNDNGGYCGC